MKINPVQWPRLKKVLALTVAGLFLLMLACKKEGSSAGIQEDRRQFASAVAESDADANLVFDNVFDNVMGVSDEVALGGTGVFGAANTCFTVSFIQANTNRFPLQVVIDFGTGCIGNDGRTRKGKIIIVYTGRLIIPGNSATTTFDGYYIDDTQVQGTLKIINTTQDKRSFTLQVTGAKLTRPNGNFTEWNSEKTITQTEGSATPVLVADDVFSLTGQSNGAVKKGDKLFQWNTQISDALVKKFACRWITRGVLTLKKGNSMVAVLDYGSGNCDNKASFTVSGTAYEITLR